MSDASTFLAVHAETFLRAALAAEYGIKIRVHVVSPDPIVTPALRARAILYRFRGELGNDVYNSLQIRLSPDDPQNRLWIIRGDVRAKGGATEGADIDIEAL